MTRRNILVAASLAAVLGAGSSPLPATASGRVFTGIAMRTDGDGYLLSSTTGQMYALGPAKAVRNPSGFAGEIADVALTANGQGALAVSSRGQFYASGTAHAWPNPTGFDGDIAGVALTADGQGAMAVSSAGQFYAYGTARAQRNPTGFSGRIADLALTADGQGVIAVSSAGQFYAYGTARAQPNPTGFTGRIAGLDVTADGQGTIAVSSAGQFYAYGTARAQQNPTDFRGEIAGVDLTGDGRGAVAMSSSGQVYAYGTARHRGNGDWGCEVHSGTEVCLDILGRYRALNGPSGPLGAPTSGQFGTTGGIGQHFRSGSIYQSPSTGAWDVRGVIREKYFAMQAEKGVLGFPITGEFSAAGGKGFGSQFTGGAIYFSGPTGTHEVHGSIRDAYSARGWENGPLGLPVTDELRGFGYWSGSGRMSFFAGGSIGWDAKGTKVRLETAGATREEQTSEALTLFNASLDDFMSVQRERDIRWKDPIDWTNDGCSGPTPEEIDKMFYEACVRHDFGARNFSPNGKGLDPTADRLDKVNAQFEIDMNLLCDRKGNPKVKVAGKSSPVTCKQAVPVVYHAVYLVATSKLAPDSWRWWRK
jgi:hypothetical protein